MSRMKGELDMVGNRNLSPSLLSIIGIYLPFFLNGKVLSWYITSWGKTNVFAIPPYS